ncbi:unnamed protein product [Zymoseptoria tritici ST99CH_1A5]|uniref:Uncharacterized protein n=3 Tax=Zymoseptoria tritici TaxID=1047171 RepID=F9XHQ1_ZYMTI|nr:uncharacterized protein MYCGRDRAFT_95177 [Zymoseptoria tritici IPO323]EGP85016.1 hypothetical protein MYCGRDRAFT_95177 [Zymoseptoria tritici IPO323]SMR56960.1 unnamed protein product [Zymoseptoria tritici ST99CH_1E4]SMR59821.1 unnamed protein product [Zymoseptoria tritici ST99CH_3D1]SMY27010.1 unnamed protein product [Zymoseptoria tritici ST99CH_1A5]
MAYTNPPPAYPASERTPLLLRVPSNLSATSTLLEAYDADTEEQAIPDIPDTLPSYRTLSPSPPAYCNLTCTHPSGAPYWPLAECCYNRYLIGYRRREARAEARRRMERSQACMAVGFGCIMFLLMILVGMTVVTIFNWGASDAVVVMTA